MSLPSHSKVGASSMSRWSKCPGSVRLSEGIEAPTSFAAAEGTVAHWVGETVLRGEKPTPHDLMGVVKEQDGHHIEVTEDMADAVKVYTDTIDADRRMDQEDEIEDYLIEHRFHLNDLHEGLFGTSDCVVYDKETGLLRVYDYKHGRGIFVGVDSNPQLMYYALGAMLTTGYKVSQVQTVIVQPRFPDPQTGETVRRSEIMDPMDLLDWSADLVQYVKATEDPNAPLHAGDHCTFCVAKAICPEIKREAQERVKQVFGPTVEYDPDELAETLDWLPTLEKWIKGVREFAHAEAMRDRTPPGYKLVSKRATRKFTDANQVIACLSMFDVAEDRVMEPRKLKSVAQVEKAIGQGEMGMLEPYITKESSGYNLVKDSDGREEADIAKPGDVFSSD